ncbi:MAG: ATP-binding protein [Pseudomonadota bacterium]
MCRTVLAGEQYHQVGQITGEPGTGKSRLTEWLAEEFGGVRVECWNGIGDKVLLQEIAHGMRQRGVSIDASGTAPSLFRRIKAECEGMLIIIDEANQLMWPTLEKLRGLSDIGRAGLILSGTDIMAKRLLEARVRIYLTQLRQRIGAKKITLRPLADPAELAAYVLVPRFGEDITAGTAKHFLRVTGGQWRMAFEVADACERLMQNESISKLDEKVIATAHTWMAGVAA